MTKRKSHLLIDKFRTPEEFTSPRRFSDEPVPLQNRTEHGQKLHQQYSSILKQFEEQKKQLIESITEDSGVYVKIIGIPNRELPLDRLDNRDFKLRLSHKVNNHEEVVVLIPESRRHAFYRKLQEYLDPKKDGKRGPRNQPLIDSIAEIKLADLQAFWADDVSLYPEDPRQVTWWELWLKKRSTGEDLIQMAHQLAKRIGARLGNTSLNFFDSAVVLIKASAEQLERAPELITNLEGLRHVKETPTVLVTSLPKEQHQWAKDLNDRLYINNMAKTSIVILDTGVNYNHMLLGRVCNEQQSEVWNPDWPHYDDSEFRIGDYNDHGSRQAGLATFGDLHEALMTNQPVVLDYWIESARILPPTGNNDPELYGDITVATVAKLEIERPEWKRVYSLAVTAESVYQGGRPSSWSAEIDQSACGMKDEIQRLFIISAGNSDEIDPNYWERVMLAQIEDPAQSWNALTVGAYTEKTTNDDPDFNGWSPLALSGDIAPSSRSSVAWGWKKHAPFKPDVVAEGGNRLLASDNAVSDADVVSLLTTSGKTSNQLFEVSRDTSAACALVSRQAAILMAEYPNYWPETIRGLLVHSAEWTPKMLERFKFLQSEHTPKVAKETMLRVVGYGVPNLERARYSANHILTLISQSRLWPFSKKDEAKESENPILNEMHLYELPWPVEALKQLPSKLEVKLRVTLSYFIEPNPGSRGYRNRYSYQSHGLRFETIRPGQSVDNFRASINKKVKEGMEDYNGPEGDNRGWMFGTQLRSRGSLHSDTWTGTAADLADMHVIAIYPVGGWWKYRTAQDRWQNSVRYSLMVSIDVPDESVDIYSVVESRIETQIALSV